MLESVSRAEDIVKVYEARLTEKETTSLSPSEVEDYMSALTVHVYCVFVCVHLSSSTFWADLTVFFQLPKRIEVQAFCGFKKTPSSLLSVLHLAAV